MAETQIGSDVLTKIQYKGENNYNLGATFDNVFFSNANAWSLKDFYNSFIKFLGESLFIQYGPTAPEFDSVKVWYDTSISE